MGVRGEIFSSKVILPNRTYFFNVKENRMGDLYLNIVESKNRENGGFDRQSVILFADDLQEFLKGFDDSLKVMENTARKKRQSGKNERDNKENRDNRRERSGKNDKMKYKTVEKKDEKKNDYMSKKSRKVIVRKKN